MLQQQLNPAHMPTLRDREQLPRALCWEGCWGHICDQWRRVLRCLLWKHRPSAFVLDPEQTHHLQAKVLRAISDWAITQSYPSLPSSTLPSKHIQNLLFSSSLLILITWSGPLSSLTKITAKFLTGLPDSTAVSSPPAARRIHLNPPKQGSP